MRFEQPYHSPESNPDHFLSTGCPSLDALADGAWEEGELRASDFGGDFVFGFATSAAQFSFMLSCTQHGYCHLSSHTLLIPRLFPSPSSPYLSLPFPLSLPSRDPPPPSPLSSFPRPSFPFPSIFLPASPPPLTTPSPYALPQVEGAVAEGGRGRSIWDDFAERAGGGMRGWRADKGEMERGEDDVALLKAMGATSYRFSISWSRIIPDGVGAVSEAGVQHYSRLIDELLANGIAPAVTLYHWDLPLHLHEAHGGWLNASIVHAFVRYADVCFSRFGDRVKTWITFNEPRQTAVQGYGYGTMAPGRCSNRTSCEQGDSSVEPYVVSHHILLAHAAAVAVYRRRYSSQWGGGGRIGMTMDCVFLYAADGTRGSADAAQRGMEFSFSW
ncbi:unnamed protein product [Closterium sp. Yama58-4]|nr:unnamed protein product [Closterium sp. Yama58-4]